MLQNIKMLQNIEKLNGEKKIGEKISESLTMPEKLKGGLFSLSRYDMLRGKRGKTFLIQFPRPNDAT